MIILNGIGCTETGAQIVLKEMIRSAPSRPSTWVLCTAGTSRAMIGAAVGRYSEGVLLIGLSHRIFGRWFRAIVELIIGLLARAGVADVVVNLSHYGLCVGGDYVLYVHSPLLMDTSTQAGWSQGKPNLIKRAMLNSCIRRARLLVLQTDKMQQQLYAYCSVSGLQVPPNVVMRPRIDIAAPSTAIRSHQFQLFYPTSRWVHKRAELAVAAVRLAYASDASIGLVITIDPSPTESRETGGVEQIGRVGQEEVYSRFAGSDALLFTSERETLGLPLLEAMEFGIAIIVPRLPYAVELLADAGCYFDGDGPEAVAEAIHVCKSRLHDYQSRVKARADVLRKTSFSWPEHWQKMLS